MGVLAIVLLVLVMLLVVISFVGSTDEILLEFWNVTVTTSVAGVFLTGVVAGLVTLAAVLMLRISVRRANKRRREVRELRERARAAEGTAIAARPHSEPATADEEVPTQADETTPLPGDDTVPDNRKPE